MKKRCTKCLEIKDTEDFYNHRGCKDGLQSYCKRCNYLLTHVYITPEQKRARAARKKVWKDLPGVREHLNQRTRNWRRRVVFKELIQHSNNHKVYHPKEKITAFQLWCIAHKQRLICPYSGLKLTRDTISVDHIIPFAKGGLNIPENIQLVHRMVNTMKNHHSSEELIEMCARITDYAHRRDKGQRPLCPQASLAQ